MDGLDCWYVCDPPTPLEARDGVVRLIAAEPASTAGAPAAVMGFHEAMSASVPRAEDRVGINLPGYRGKNFVPVLSALVSSRLAGQDAVITWHVDRQQGPQSVQRLLGSLGWELDRTRNGRTTVLSGGPPAPQAWPEPRDFTSVIGAVSLRLSADYGVFSPGGVDAGTALLLSVALQGPRAEVLADIGIGYGPIAIALVKNGIAGRAVGTDVDSVALWLAQRNAEAAGVRLEVAWSPDPLAAGPADLTVCNIPTHITADQTREFMTGLLARARHGRLLAVVHASLEARYLRYFTRAGLRPARHPGPAHVVFDVRS